MNLVEISLPDFKQAYEACLGAGGQTFTYGGHEFVVGYAKYLIEYLEGFAGHPRWVGGK